MERCKHEYSHLFIYVALIFSFFIVLIVFLVFYCKSTEVIASGPKLIIDHDGGADDAMAIFMALLYEKYFDGPNVVGLTTVHGNVDEAQVFNNSQRILDIAQRRNVPIFRGSKSALVQGHETDNFFGYDGLGDNETVIFRPIASNPEHAALALIRLSKKYEGDISVVALGALTNIALAIKLDSDFTSRLSRLYVAAGNMYSENDTDAEFNALMDVEAYHVVAAERNPEKITIIPFSQIKNYINISNEWRNDVLGAIPTEIMQAQNVFEQVSQRNSTSWQLLDPAAMAVALIHSSFVKETSYSEHSIHLCGEERGINSNKLTTLQNATAKMVMTVEEKPYMKFLLDVFSAPLR